MLVMATPESVKLPARLLEIPLPVRTVARFANAGMSPVPLRALTPGPVGAAARVMVAQPVAKWRPEVMRGA
jgi:hypothetical protein